MSSLASLSQQCLFRFNMLTSTLANANSEHVEIMPLETIQAQAGKLRVWCGNLGALQTGYSSLDYRLQETPVMQSTVSRLLQQLSNALLESIAVTSGARLPFEDQPKPADMSEESTDDDSDLEAGSGPRKELALRLSSITDCLNSLYRQSYKIRNPTLRLTTTKAILYKEVDPETNVDVFDKLYELDVMHIHELLVLLREGRECPAGFENFLGPRLATSITLRRRCFKYWQKHSRKLSRAAEIGEEVSELPGLDISNMQLGRTPGNADDGHAVTLSPLPAAPAAATILSRTDATPYDATRDDITEKDTVISFVSTALDADGKGIDLPGPPPEAKRGLEFTCPFCHVLCPAKQGRGRAWRQHVLHDLQPYVCTYQDCPQPNELYRTRNQWIKHEDSTHRQCWRCFKHTDHVYISESGLRSHLVTDHAATMTADQIDDLMGVYSSTLVDDREYCPICLLKQPFPRGMANHLANHLERAALFALPRTQLGAGDSENGSAESHGKRVIARSSRDTEDTLSSFKGTVADESESDMEGPGGDAATRMRRRLRGNETTASISRAPKDPEVPRGSYEEFYAPYTVFKLRKDLDELELESKSKGRIFSRRRTSFFRSRQASVKGRWKAHEDILVDAFNGRDIVFLVDNGSTMADHWQEATELLATLIRRAIGYDDDGIELYFTSQKNMEKSAVPLSNQGVEDFTRAMNEERPGSNGYPTDIVTSLSSVMAKYIIEKKKPKPKTIIILTDGVWEGMTNESAVDELIIHNLMCLRAIRPDTSANGNAGTIEAMRPLTIQFVRFGQNPEALERLRRLDDCLVDYGVDDVVDCEPSGGDVYKMFLGSLLKEMDERENITNIVSPITPSVSRGPSLRNGNRGADDDDNDDDSGFN